MLVSPAAAPVANAAESSLADLTRPTFGFIDRNKNGYIERVGMSMLHSVLSDWRGLSNLVVVPALLSLVCTSDDLVGTAGLPDR
jgi:hypothetical protein